MISIRSCTNKTEPLHTIRPQQIVPYILIDIYA